MSQGQVTDELCDMVVEQRCPPVWTICSKQGLCPTIIGLVVVKIIKPEPLHATTTNNPNLAVQGAKLTNTPMLVFLTRANNSQYYCVLQWWYSRVYTYTSHWPLLVGVVTTKAGSSYSVGHTPPQLLVSVMVISGYGWSTCKCARVNLIRVS